MTQLLLSNLVFGESYADIYLGAHLSAILDASNLPAVRDRIAVELYTDHATKPILEAHPNWQRLISAGVPLLATALPLPKDAHERRYGVLGHCFYRSLHRAYDESRALMFSTADTIYGQGFLPKILEKLDLGHDAVMGVTMRGTAEVMAKHMADSGRAWNATELYNVCRVGLHPLWQCSHWKAPDFSRLPYALLWSDPKQLIVRPLTITAVAFVTNQRMLSVGPETPDMVVDPFLVNPFYAHEWYEFPMVECQHLKSFWPPFRPGPANIWEYIAWMKQAAPEGSDKNLQHSFHYYDPSNPPSDEARKALQAESDSVVKGIEHRAMHPELYGDRAA